MELSLPVSGRAIGESDRFTSDASGDSAPLITFTIGHRYEAPVPVAHLDLYRVTGVGPEEWGDLEPYFDGTIAFVEWPEHAGAWLPPVRAAVSLEHVDEQHRRVRIESENDLRL